jgi:hypothetical protein
MTERIVVTIENLPDDRDVTVTINVPGKIAPVDNSMLKPDSATSGTAAAHADD